MVVDPELSPDTVGYPSVKLFDTPGCRRASATYSRQYEDETGP